MLVTSSVSRQSAGVLGLIGPRIAVDFWVTPRLTLSIQRGVDLVGPVADAQVGWALSFHMRPYDQP